MQEEDILYLDNHLLAIHKPAGIPTQPVGEGANLEELAKKYLKTRFNRPGNVFLQPLYRLDKPVSGVVLFARTSKALARVMQSIRQRAYQKIYHGVVEGQLKEPEGALENLLVHENFYARVAFAPSKEAKFCRLRYSILKSYATTTLVKIELDTGRYHQIRAQFAAFGHPIVGDFKYGSRLPSSLPEAILLHHQRLEIAHPVTCELLLFEAAYPSYWHNK